MAVRLLLLAVGAVALYYLAPQLVAVFASAPQLSRVNWPWLAVMFALEVASFAAAWGLARLAVPGLSLAGGGHGAAGGQRRQPDRARREWWWAGRSTSACCGAPGWSRRGRPRPSPPTP